MSRHNRKVSQLPAESPADCCRRNGWKVGTHLVGDEGYGPIEIIIVAIGEKAVLAKSEVDGDEATWSFHCRDWKVVA